MSEGLNIQAGNINSGMPVQNFTRQNTQNVKIPEAKNDDFTKSEITSDELARMKNISTFLEEHRCFEDLKKNLPTIEEKFAVDTTRNSEKDGKLNPGVEKNDVSPQIKGYSYNAGTSIAGIPKVNSLNNPRTNISGVPKAAKTLNAAGYTGSQKPSGEKYILGEDGNLHPAGKPGTKKASNPLNAASGYSGSQKPSGKKYILGEDGTLHPAGKTGAKKVSNPLNAASGYSGSQKPSGKKYILGEDGNLHPAGKQGTTNAPTLNGNNFDKPDVVRQTAPEITPTVGATLAGNSAGIPQNGQQTGETGLPERHYDTVMPSVRQTANNNPGQNHNPQNGVNPSMPDYSGIQNGTVGATLAGNAAGIPQNGQPGEVPPQYCAQYGNIPVETQNSQQYFTPGQEANAQNPYGTNDFNSAYEQNNVAGNPMQPGYPQNNGFSNNGGYQSPYGYGQNFSQPGMQNGYYTNIPMNGATQNTGTQPQDQISHTGEAKPKKESAKIKRMREESKIYVPSSQPTQFPPEKDVDEELLNGLMRKADAVERNAMKTL